MKRQYLFLALLASTLSLQASDLAFAGMDNQIACSSDMAQYQCNTCFDGGFLYEGKEKTSLYDIAKNTGTLRNVYFADENGNNAIQIKNRGGSGVVFTTPIFDYHSDFFTLNRIKFPGTTTWAPMTHPDGSVKWGTIMDPGASYKWTETLPGKELYVTSVNKSTVNDANRSMIRDKNFVVVYSLKTQFRNTTTKTWEGSNTHVECQQIGIHFCGDGLAESAYGEQCDDGGQNGQPGKCNTSCTGTVPPTSTPSCDSISAIPTFGASPLTTTLTCNGSNLPTGATYAIECGNSTNATMNGNKGTCTYINTSTTNSATYGAKCTINNTITSQACQMNIGVNPTPTPPVCNPAKTGTQNSPVQSTDPLCATGTPSGFTQNGSNPINYSWSCNNASQSIACTASYTSSTTGSGFDLSLKKYIGTGSVDAQPGAAVSVNTGDRINYLIRVTNSGPQTSSGVTKVQDILPVGVTASGSASGSGWSCSYSGAILTCTSTQMVASGSTYPDITVPVIVTATAGQSVTNIAAVDNTNEANRCNTDGSLPANAATSCNKDPNNSDPAVITIPGGGGGGGGGGASHVGKVCVNGVISCVYYNSFTACTQADIPAALCYPADATGLNSCNAQSLKCGGGGGGGSTSGGIAGRCGDGILQPAGADHTAGTSDDEECDRPGSLWCSNSCKVVGLTNPGANPIMDLWMTIPVLAGTKHLGYTWLDGTPGKVPFSDYRMVLGVGTKAFTLADTVGFGIRTQFQIPIMIEESKKICITSTGSSLSPQTLCTTFGEAVAGQSGIHRFQRFDGTKYVVLGNGDYQYQTGATFPYKQETLTTNSNNINLFRGATQYTPLGTTNLGPTLNSAFFGAQAGNDGVISLVACTGTNCTPTATVELVKFDVRVSSAMVSSIGSSSNRALESFINPVNPFVGFLGTNMNTSTTSSNNSTNTTTVNLPTIVGTTGNQSSTGVADLERFAVNGNRNILAISGSLTIENCPSNTFVMTGVRTVIVTGDLIIKCNIGYGTNNDASWAWIAKNGNIKVYNGTGTPNVGAVTNLAGVFVAVKDSVGGDITYTGSNTTQAILRIEGSIYGNAKPLFDSRLYGRATGAYDILTTGTVISYSNRALMSPPPLLSQYLGAYSVQRVVQ